MDIKSRLNLCAPYIVTSCGGIVLYNERDITNKDNISCNPYLLEIYGSKDCVHLRSEANIYSEYCGSYYNASRTTTFRGNGFCVFTHNYEENKASYSSIVLCLFDGSSHGLGRSLVELTPGKARLYSGQTVISGRCSIDMCADHRTSISASCVHIQSTGSDSTQGGFSVDSEDYIRLESCSRTDLCAQEVYVKAGDGDIVLEANGNESAGGDDSGSGCSDGSGRIILSAENGVEINSDVDVNINSTRAINSKACKFSIESPQIELHAHEVLLKDFLYVIPRDGFVCCPNNLTICSPIATFEFDEFEIDADSVYTYATKGNLENYALSDRNGEYGNVYIEADGGVGIVSYTQQLYMSAEDYGAAIIMGPHDNNENIGNIKIMAPTLNIEASTGFNFNPVVINETTNYTDKTLVTKKYVDDIVSRSTSSKYEIPALTSQSGKITWTITLDEEPSVAPIIQVFDKNGNVIYTDVSYNSGIITININNTSSVSVGDYYAIVSKMPVNSTHKTKVIANADFAQAALDGNIDLNTIYYIV